MRTIPLRLLPRRDLREQLKDAVLSEAGDGGFVIAGIGSLTQANLRFAGAAEVTTLPGPLEILTLVGTVSTHGAHLHMSVSDSQGRIFGGHLGQGSIVRTTAEVLVVPVSGWRLERAFDAQTGYDELVVRRLDEQAT